MPDAHRGFWKDYLREVFKAFWRALERTDTLVIFVFIISGIIISAVLGGQADHPSWKVAFAIFIVSFSFCSSECPIASTPSNERL